MSADNFLLGLREGLTMISPLKIGLFKATLLMTPKSTLRLTSSKICLAMISVTDLMLRQTDQMAAQVWHASESLRDPTIWEPHSSPHARVCQRQRATKFA